MNSQILGHTKVQGFIEALSETNSGSAFFLN